ncbi:methyl-accepting chemotaxis protein [Geomonas sp. Red32]|uniref:methyl-accepting chemotaxis protein n=1 Tax=Geomonas sp. Red32 TaxID=2912856 RepID=UPI00202CD0B1|nr:HAMP domain-containing methyl-accepting chemotaxis protein [Geomonas sp. Red32]MCM0082404.1 methyl-accepting chemotaxis protein [Geomonas sp. Red32]
MAINLRLGYNFIRLSLASGVAIAVAGVACISNLLTMLPPGHEGRGYAYAALVFLALEGAVAAGVLAMLASRKLAQRVRVLAAALDRGADGDLTTRLTVTTMDDLGALNNNFNTMMERLSGVVAKVNHSIAELTKIAGDMNEVAQNGVNSAELQSEGVNSASVAVQEINEAVLQIARWVEGLSSSATDNASSILEMSASIEEVNLHVEALSAAVDEVSASIIEMTAAERQIGESADSLMQESATTSALVGDLDVSIKQVGENAAKTAAISESVRRDAEEGRKAVEATIAGFNEIRSSSSSSVEAIENLAVRTVDIGKILMVIDEVAEQTKLLALNASIIAAQAGEHGKGFAVVAEEIKELARRTRSSTQEISEIIGGVQEETDRVVSAIRLSEKRIVEGDRLSKRSGEALKKIVAGVQQAAGQVDEIADFTEAQSRMSQNMSNAMQRVADMVRQIARATREQGRGSELIISAVQRMKDLTAQVRISTRAQSESSNHIVRATEDITATIGDVRQACEDETRSSKLIVNAMENIQESSRSNVESTRVINGAVSGLSRQVALLQQEMAGLRYQQGASARNAPSPSPPGLPEPGPAES